MGGSLEITAILQALIIAFLTFITWLFQSKIRKLEQVIKEIKQEQVQKQNITIQIHPQETIKVVEEVPEMFESIAKDLNEIKNYIYKIMEFIEGSKG